MNFEDWLKRYQERGLTLEENLGRTVMQATEEVLERPGTNLVDINLRLRELRQSFEPRFCLLLYARSTDEQLLGDAWKISGSSKIKDLMNARNLSSDLDLNQSMTALMLLLDQLCSLHMVMLERGETREFEGPVRLNPSDDFWFNAMSSAAELAWVVIVVTKFGPNLIRELRYLSDAGLRRRFLLFTGQSLWQDSPSGEPQQWGLEELTSAVRQAAESPAHPPDRDTIDQGY